MTREFLCTYLPPLTFKDSPPISFEMLMNLYEMNLSAREMADIRALRQYFDVQNIKLSLINEKIDGRALLDREDLKKALFEKADLPESTVAILEDYTENSERLGHIDEMISRYLQEMERRGGMIGELAKFERGLRATFTAFRAKAMGLDVEAALSFEDRSDPVIMDLFATAKSGGFDLPAPFSHLDVQWGEDPRADFEMACHYRFQWLQERMEQREFTFDWIIGYTLQLVLLENVSQTKKASDDSIIDTILKDIA